MARRNDQFLRTAGLVVVGGTLAFLAYTFWPGEAQTSARLSVRSVSQTGQEITGMWTVLTRRDGTREERFTPTTFDSVPTGEAHTLQTDSFGDRTFQMWSDGQTAKTRPITLSRDTTIRSVYSVSLPPPNGYDTFGMPAVMRKGYVGTIVPLYEGAEGPVPGINTVLSTHAEFPGVPMAIIINHNNGRVSSAGIRSINIDGSLVFVPSNFRDAARQLTNAGIPVLAYVHTRWNTRPITEVMSDMDVWARDVPEIVGWLWDEQNNGGGQEWYTRQLWDKAKQMGRPFCIGNPGTNTEASYMSTATVLFTYESGGWPQPGFCWNCIETLRARWSVFRERVGLIPLDVSGVNEQHVRNTMDFAKWHYWVQAGLSGTWNSLNPNFRSIVALLDRINKERGSTSARLRPIEVSVPSFM